MPLPLALAGNWLRASLAQTCFASEALFLPPVPEPMVRGLPGSPDHPPEGELVPGGTS